MRQSIVQKLNLTGFIADYVAFAETITDAPLEFHLGAGLTALATVCGSKIIYPSFGGRRAWPNLYVLLIAPSGLFRKSTAVGISEDLVADVDSNLILTGEQSREKFLSLLKDNPNVMYPISEFSAVLSMWNREYSQGFREIVTDLFDNRKEYSRQTLKDGKVTIHEPSMSILAASTADWLREKLTEGDLRGGLMGRFLMFPGITKNEDKGLNPGVDKEAKGHLVTFLKSIANLQRSWVDVTPQLVMFNKWVKEMERRLMKQPNPDMVGFQSRLGAHTLKLAILFCIAENGACPQYILSADHLSKAITLATWLNEKSQELAETGFIKSKFEQQVQRLLEAAKRNGGVSRNEAMRMLHVSLREFDSITGTAIERGELISEKVPVERSRPKMIYKTRAVSPQNREESRDVSAKISDVSQ